MNPRFMLTCKASCCSRRWLNPHLRHHEKPCFEGVHVSGTLRSDIVVILEIRGVCNVMYHNVYVSVLYCTMMYVCVCLKG